MSFVGLEARVRFRSNCPFVRAALSHETIDRMDEILKLLLAELRSEREAAVRHFEGLDTKAGIVLGFSGLLVAFPAADRTLIFAAGQGAAIVSALTALIALLPRRFPLFLGRSMDRAMSGVEPAEAGRRLVAGLLRAERYIVGVLRSKARLLRLAGTLLVLSLALIGADALLGRGEV